MPREHGSTLSILVVEDDQTAAELARAILNDVPGWGATVVYDAAAAREVFKHVTTEVLVLDVNCQASAGWSFWSFCDGIQAGMSRRSS